MSWNGVLDILRDKNGLEFGGITELFYDSRHNMLLYPYVKLDGANRFSYNYFNGEIDKSYNYKFGEGIRYDCDASCLEDIVNINKKYDFIVTSHVIEHIANPIRSIKLWIEYLLNDGGYILSIVPYYRACFDRNRPLTKFEHIIEDYERGVGENDITHIEEQKKLHDWSLGGHRDFYELCDINEETRVVHHHTFDIKNVGCLFEYLNMEIVFLYQHDPLNIVCLSKIK